MFIVNKQRSETFNLSLATNIYIGATGCAIKIATGPTARGGILGEYDTYEETTAAFLMLIKGIEGEERVFRMPSDMEVREKNKAHQAEKYHHITGKKTKGHGGS